MRPPTRTQPSPRNLVIASAALLAVGACQPAPTPPARSSGDAPAHHGATGAATPPAPRGPAPAAPGDAPPPRDGAAPPAQVAVDAGAAGAALDGRSPVRLAPPPFAQALFRPAPAGGSSAPRLVKIAEKKNAITDQEAWFTRNGLSLPILSVPGSPQRGDGALPSFVPARHGDHRLVRAIDHGDHLALFYGPDASEARLVAILDGAHRVVAFLDFDSFLTPPEHDPKEARFVRGQVRWAVARDGVLYVSTGHSTYAASSRGKNAYLSALDLATGQLLWQSAPLVCNAENFVLRGDHLLCGYGFTAEPDFIFVLERTTGTIVSKIPIKSGPEVLVEKDGKLFVRTYDTDYVFEIR
ncbi:hypothetical protein WMF31_11535 [Sorangium sp. So ce1036]|uniref:hypothetical protein n=1 Tax=Sorangium sp. So ce1036 TaxID=3133328 RepID=UPI003F0B5150